MAWVRRRYGLQQHFAYGNLNFKPSAPHCTPYSPEHCQGLLLGSEPVVSPDYCLAWSKNLKKKRGKKGWGEAEGQHRASGFALHAAKPWLGPQDRVVTPIPRWVGLGHP